MKLGIKSNDQFRYLKGINGKSDPIKAKKIVRDMRNYKFDASVQGACLVALFKLGEKKANRARLYDYGVVLVVITAMRTFPNEERLQEAGCAALCSTAFNIYVCIRQGAGDELLRCMETFPNNTSIQLKCCMTLKEYAKSNFGANYLAKANAGILLHMTMKRFPLNPLIQAEGCAAVWMFCSHASHSTVINTLFVSENQPLLAIETRDIIWKIGFANIILSLLKLEVKRKNDNVLENALGALWSLDHPIVFASLGCDKLVVKFLKQKKAKPKIIAMCLNILGRYASIESVASSLLQYKICKKIYSLMQEETYRSDTALAEASCLFYSSMAYWDECKKQVFDAGAVEIVAKILELNRNTEGIVEIAVKVFANLSTDQAIAEVLFENTIPGQVMEAVNSFKNCQGILETAVLFIRNLAFYDKQRVLPLLGCIQYVKRAIKTTNSEIIKESGEQAIKRMVENQNKI